MVLAAGALSRRPLLLLLAAGAALGRASGELALTADRDRCAARLPPGRVRLRVRLTEPVDAVGGRVQVAPLAARCTGEVAARWPAGTAVDAGLDSRVEAVWIPRAGVAGRADGILVVRGADSADGSSESGRSTPDRPRSRESRRSTAPARRWSMRSCSAAEGASIPTCRIGSPSRGWCTCSRSRDSTSGLIGGWIFLIARLAGAATRARR